MKNSEIGRNDPCPCGSGKKYKKCCLGRQTAEPSTTGAAGIFADIRQAMADHQFASLEEAQAFAEGFMQQRNRTSNDDFHGLSPEQMHRLLNFPFASPQLVTFPDVLETTPAAPVLVLFDLLIEAIGRQGLKPTAKGNLPQKFCRKAALTYWGDGIHRENKRIAGLNKEEDFLDLHVTRLVSQVAGLVRKYKGRFILSQDFRALLTADKLAGIYPRLFRAYTGKFNWAYRDGYPEIGFIQRSFLFTLYLLDRYGDSWRPHSFYEDNFLRAFPMVLNEIETNTVLTPEQEVSVCYTWRTLVNFVGFFGLAALEPLTDESYTHKYRVMKLPLLGEAVRFHM